MLVQFIFWPCQVPNNILGTFNKTCQKLLARRTYNVKCLWKCSDLIHNVACSLCLGNKDWFHERKRSSEGWFVSNHHSYGNITIFPYWRPPNNQCYFFSDKMSTNSYHETGPPQTIGNTWVYMTLITLFLKFVSLYDYKNPVIVIHVYDDGHI
jgi:hypothetical protein